MTENEKYVRDRWDAQQFKTGSGYNGRQGRKPEEIKPEERYFYVRIELGMGWEADLYFSARTQALAWKKAAKYTRDHEATILQMEEDSRVLNSLILSTPTGADRESLTNINIREMVARAELKKGMKGKSK